MSKNNTVKINSHHRSTPNHSNPWQGPGNKPGPKSVRVREHERSK